MKRMKAITGGLTHSVRQFIKEEEGVGVVEIVLILVILIGLVVAFQDEIEQIVDDALGKFSEDASGVYE